jgi:hypothetical protein
MAEEKNVSTEVKEVEWTGDLDDLLGTKSSTTILPDEESKRSVLESTKIDTSFLDNPDESGKEDENNEGEDNSAKPTEAKPSEDELGDILNDPKIEDDDEDEDEAPVNKGGRKPALIEAMSKLIDILASIPMMR